MVEAVFHYFKAEKKESLFWIGIGVVSVLLTFYFLLIKSHPYYNGLAYVLITIGVIQLVHGISAFKKGNLNMVSVDYFVQKDLDSIKSKEIPRMEVEMKHLTIYSWIEMGCIILGLLLFLFCRPFTLGKGIGMGLLIQASVLLILDYFAEQRGKEYLNFLKSLFHQQ
jgi:hypothetical protein